MQFGFNHLLIYKMINYFFVNHIWPQRTKECNRKLISGSYWLAPGPQRVSFFVSVTWGSCYLGWIEGNLDHLYDTFTERCLEGNIWDYHKLSGTSSQSLSVAPFLNNKAPGQKKVNFLYVNSSSDSGRRCMFWGNLSNISIRATQHNNHSYSNFPGLRERGAKTVHIPTLREITGWGWCC